MLIHNKDDIEFVTEFPCLLGHPVHEMNQIKVRTQLRIVNQEHPRVSTELPNQKMRQIGQGVHELWLDIQTDTYRYPYKQKEISIFVFKR